MLSGVEQPKHKLIANFGVEILLLMLWTCGASPAFMLVCLHCGVRVGLQGRLDDDDDDDNIASQIHDL